MYFWHFFVSETLGEKYKLTIFVLSSVRYWNADIKNEEKSVIVYLETIILMCITVKTIFAFVILLKLLNFYNFSSHTHTHMAKKLGHMNDTKIKQTGSTYWPWVNEAGGTGINHGTELGACQVRSYPRAHLR